MVFDTVMNFLFRVMSGLYTSIFTKEQLILREKIVNSCQLIYDLKTHVVLLYAKLSINNCFDFNSFIHSLFPLSRDCKHIHIKNILVI